MITLYLIKFHKNEWFISNLSDFKLLELNLGEQILLYIFFEKISNLCIYVIKEKGIDIE